MGSGSGEPQPPVLAGWVLGLENPSLLYWQDGFWVWRTPASCTGSCSTNKCPYRSRPQPDLGPEQETTPLIPPNTPPLVLTVQSGSPPCGGCACL
ncbi:unnamed protein product [Arctogadus glacialis]